MHLIKEDVLHQLNVAKDRPESFEILSQGQLRIIKDHVEWIHDVLDRRASHQPVSQDRRSH